MYSPANKENTYPDPGSDDNEIIAYLQEQEQKTQSVRAGIVRPYWLIILPAVIITIAFIFPFLWGLFLSLTRYKLNNPVYAFNWGINYWYLIKSPGFWATTFRTFEYTVFAVGVELILGFVIASLLNTETAMAKIGRRLIALPLMIAPSVATVLLKLMLNNQFGVVNYLMSPFGLIDFPWGASVSTAMFTVLIVDIWIYTPFMVLIILAGLRSMPKDPFEAAAVDGAGYWNVLKNLTIPMVMPTILIAVIFRVIDSVKIFDIIWGMTSGGPGTSTTVYSISGYVYTFGSLNVSKGSTIMIITWVIILLMSKQLVKYFDLARRRLGQNVNN